MEPMSEPVIVLDPTARRMYFDDTFGAFAAFRDQRPGVCATIEADPLGDVNRIVRICRIEGGKRTSVKAALVPITAGTTVTLSRDESTWGIAEVFALREGSWRIPPDPEPQLRELPPTPGWRVDVDGHTVLRAADLDIWPQPPAPRVPMRLRATQAARRACSERLRRLGDAIADRFGYIRDDEDRW